MSVTTYGDMSITDVRHTSNPDFLVQLGSDLTQKKIEPGLFGIKKASRSLVEFLFRANHTSVFEHASITVLIEGVSRSFLAQITRHRMCSFTSASQHYQNYTNYASVVSKKYANDPDILNALAMSEYYYGKVVETSMPVEEARQILSNAKAVNILWTINARSLLNFLNLRLCRRNVEEMYIFAQKMHDIAIQWWPQLFDLVGPDCKYYRTCTQGPMQAKECKGVVRLWTDAD